MDNNQASKYLRCFNILACKMDKLATNNIHSALMVEGKNDKTFFTGVKVNRECFFPNNAVAVFKEDKEKHNETYTSSEVEINSKVFIKDSIEGIQLIDQINSLDAQKKQSIKSWDLYGIVDRDYARVNPADSLTKLLCDNNSCDIETLLLHSQSDLAQIAFSRKGISVTKDRITKAIFMAYQVGVVKHYLSDTTHKLRGRNLKNLFPYFHYEFTREVIDELFVDDYLDIDYLLDKWGVASVSDDDIDAVINRMINDRDYSKLFNYDATWAISLQGFKYQLPSDTYRKVSGHDIVSFLLYVTPEAQGMFSTAQSDRELESALVAAYDKATNFANTDLYKQIYDNNLIDKSIYGLPRTK